MKRFLLIFLISLPLFANGQALTRCIDSFRAIMLTNYPSPTTAQYNYVTQYVTRQCNAIAAYVGSAGYGTVTSITPGIGFTSSIPITTAGYINIDTVGQIASKLWVINSIPSPATFIPYSDTGNKIITYTQLKDSTIAIRIWVSGLGFVTTAQLNDSMQTVRDSLVSHWYAIKTRIKYSDTSGIIVTTTMLNDTAFAHMALINARVKYTDSNTKYVTPTQLQDSAYGHGTVTSVSTGRGLRGGTITTTGTLTIDSAAVYTNRQTDSDIVSRGYITTAVTSVGLVAGTGMSITGSTSPITSTGTYTITNTSPSSGGTVTSVGANRGITGGTITTTGTHGLDTTQAYTWLGSQTVSISSIGATNVTGFGLVNPTAATTVTAQYAPQYIWQGTWYNSTSSASQPYSWAIRNTSNTNVGIPTLHWTLGFNYNGGAFTTLIDCSNGGVTLYALGVSNTSTFNGLATFNASATIASGKLNITTGSNKSAGTATLSSGTVTVSTTQVTANSLIHVEYQSGSALSGATLTRIIRVSTQTAGISFVVVAETAPGTTNTSDNSNIQWWLIN